MAEGAPLLRAYRVKPIEGSNPSLSANFSLVVILSYFPSKLQRGNRLIMLRVLVNEY